MEFFNVSPARQWMLIALIATISVATAFDFQDGAGGVKWALSCDFYGADIAAIPGPGEQCGGQCVSNPQCTHFTWFQNTCYLKRVTGSASATYLNGGVCGYVANRGSSAPSGSVQPAAPSWSPSSSGSTSSGGVELAVVNNCAFPTWLAILTNPDQRPLPDGEQRIAPGQRYVYKIPSSGWAGRFWPKFGCDATGNNCDFGQSSPPCPPGGCQPPADTKVEFLFPPQPATSGNTQSWYDISFVDGFTLGVKIVPRGVNSGSCIPTTCSIPMSACPSNENNGLGDLRYIKNGKVVACLAPCKKWNSPAPFGYGRNELLSPGVNMCCPTPPISVDQCRTGPVVNTNYVKLIRQACPTAYSYAYDDEGGLHACPGSTSFDVTLCP